MFVSEIGWNFWHRLCPLLTYVLMFWESCFEKMTSFPYVNLGAAVAQDFIYWICGLHGVQLEQSWWILYKYGLDSISKICNLCCILFSQLSFILKAG